MNLITKVRYIITRYTTKWVIYDLLTRHYERGMYDTKQAAQAAADKLNESEVS